MLKYWDRDGNEIGLSAAVEFKRQDLEGYKEAQKAGRQAQKAGREAKKQAQKAGREAKRLAAQEPSVAAARERQQQIASGSWWLNPYAFRSLGFAQRLSATNSHYLGGWSAHPKPYTGNKTLVIDKRGVSLSGISTIFTVPWDQIIDLEIEGPDTASKRVTAGRALTLGVFSLVAKKTQRSAVLIARLRSGEEAIFQTEKFMAAELHAKLVSITSQLRKANGSSELTDSASVSPPPAGSLAAPASVADELRKLAELKEAGLLTDEEFAGQKAKLLGS